MHYRSVRRNIVFGLEPEDGDAEVGCSPPTQDDVVAAAKLANAHDFITAMPEVCSSKNQVPIS